MSESSLFHPTRAAKPLLTLVVVLPAFPMKLATVLRSLRLTGSVLDFSKMIATVDTYIKKETLIAKSRVLVNIGPDGVKTHGALV